MVIRKRPPNMPAAAPADDADARAEAFIAAAPDGHRAAPAAPAPPARAKPVPVTFTVEPALLAAFDAACAARGLSSRSAGLALVMSKAVSEGF